MRFVVLMDRASRRMGKIFLRVIQKEKYSCTVDVQEHQDFPNSQLECTEKSECWKQTLFRILSVGAVFHLFVFMFYQNSDEPALEQFSSSRLRDERVGAWSPLFLSLFFWVRERFGLDFVGNRFLLVLLNKIQPVMEKSYV